MISFISSILIIKAVMPDWKTFFWIFASAAAAFNLNGIKTLLANGFSTFFIKGKPVLSNRPKSLAKNPPDYLILDNWYFENVILADEPFAKALQTFVTFLIILIFKW